MTTNLKRHEIIGLLLVFLGATCFGIGVYMTIYVALRPFETGQFISGKEFLLFPLFYGMGALLWSLGKIELKEAMPGRVR